MYDYGLSHFIPCYYLTILFYGECGKQIVETLDIYFAEEDMEIGSLQHYNCCIAFLRIVLDLYPYNFTDKEMHELSKFIEESRFTENGEI